MLKSFRGAWGSPKQSQQCAWPQNECFRVPVVRGVSSRHASVELFNTAGAGSRRCHPHRQEQAVHPERPSARHRVPLRPRPLSHQLRSPQNRSHPVRQNRRSRSSMERQARLGLRPGSVASSPGYQRVTHQVRPAEQHCQAADDRADSAHRQRQGSVRHERSR